MRSHKLLWAWHTSFNSFNTKLSIRKWKVSNKSLVDIVLVVYGKSKATDWWQKEPKCAR